MVQITVKNDAGIIISERFLQELRSCSNIAQGKILLSLSKTELPNNLQGACVPSQFIEKYAPHYYGICDCHSSTSYDCCIAIAKEYCDLHKCFPAYFAYLLGHEIGHAKICIEDIKLHVHCCLIHDFIYEASGGKIYPHESPHEQLFDKFGKYLSAKLYASDQLNNEIITIEPSKNDCEKNRLAYIRATSPSKDFSDLRENLIAFSMPYKDELIKLWKTHIQKQGAVGELSLAKEITNTDELFELT